MEIGSFTWITPVAFMVQLGFNSDDRYDNNIACWIYINSCYNEVRSDVMMHCDAMRCHVMRCDAIQRKI